MLADIFARARAQGRIALIAYVVAGDPDLDTTERAIDAFGDAGVDLIELGIPYSDPLADGPSIATAANRALAAGTTPHAVFALGARIAARGGPPFVYFTYVNPIDQMGYERFADSAAASGSAGAIVPDLPLEESEPLRRALDVRGLALPLLVAPTTPFARATAIVSASRGFVYVVSRLGVTGAGRRPDFAATAERVAGLRQHATLPLAVGFGIATPADVGAVAEFADGAIVGSALVDAVSGARGAGAARIAGAFIRPLVAASRTKHPADQLGA